jgi:stress response protein SCP2
VIVNDVKGLIGGDQRTSVIPKTLNPVWNQTFTNRFNYKLSEFKFKLFDSDADHIIDLNGDDPIGKTKLPIDVFIDKACSGQPAEIDTWLPLQKATSGRLHVRAKVTFNIPLALPGVRIALPPSFQIGLAWDFKKKAQPVDLDASIVGLDANEREVDKVWYSRLVGFGGAISHSGDDRTGEGGGDDETITVNLERLPGNVEKLAVCINSFTSQPLSSVKFAYIRLISHGRTLAFYGMGKGKVPNCTGLLFGVVQRSPAGGWEFVTTAAEANGRNVQESQPAIIAYGKRHLGW